MHTCTKIESVFVKCVDNAHKMRVVPILQLLSIVCHSSARQLLVSTCILYWNSFPISKSILICPHMVITIITLSGREVRQDVRYVDIMSISIKSLISSDRAGLQTYFLAYNYIWRSTDNRNQRNALSLSLHPSLHPPLVVPISRLAVRYQ